MYVTAEEFLDMLQAVRERYRGGGYNLEDPQVMHTLLMRDFPHVEGVVPPPSYETIRERYIPEEWRMAIPQPRHRGGPAWTAGTPEDEFATTDPVEEERRRILADLDSLRGDPICAMSYVVQRSRGMDSRTAMTIGRATGHVFQLYAMANHHAYIRSVSGTTGRRRDSRTARDMHIPDPQPATLPGASRRAPLTLSPMSTAMRPGYPARTPATTAMPRASAPVTRQPAPTATSASPDLTRERLRRMAAQAGSPGSPRRR
ncbi:MAG: hypothetical protein MUD15_13260 [Desulfobacterota bacterium]|nr:hypothetical protein [Thermodesulfobacteriota bacterium]